MSQYWYVPPSDFLSQMPDRDREELLSRADQCEYEKGQYIFQAGDPGNHVYILDDGRAKIFQVSAQGKEMILWFCLPGEVFGLTEVLRGGVREVHAQACTPCSVYAISRKKFQSFLMDYPATSQQIIELLSCRMRVLGHMMMNLATDDVASRIVKLMMRLAARYQGDDRREISLDIPLTHQEIADMIGASRQTVTSVLGELRRRGILQVEGHCITIRDHEQLAHVLDSGAGEMKLQ